MKVLIILLGEARRPAALAEGLAVLAGGGTATVLVHETGPWTAALAEAGLTVRSRAELARRHWPQRLARFVLWRVPAGLARAAGRGPLRAPAERAAARYRSRVAGPVQRRLVDRVHRRLWRDAAVDVVAAHLAREDYDAVVPADPHAVLLLEQVLRRDAGAARRRIAYSVAHLPAGGTV
ncbi:hypothetical protein GCM10010124_01070 [Pilimelia terevasa]|uniref:Uncharacterized protein n=1 Tax=Pilimelia terevasa TaxID=53372 RepID=A0A8J3BCW2_9ACTN|nr:hypothetical protein [Pilimelia terevasa]GGK12341.1 hypothetical protein GCM10010124_01070 [Pilimelia terevasa]